jgi:hypothetical protein
MRKNFTFVNLPPEAMLETFTLANLPLEAIKTSTLGQFTAGGNGEHTLLLVVWLLMSFQQKKAC